MVINTVVTLSAWLTQSAALQLGCKAKLVWKKNKKENNDKSPTERLFLSLTGIRLARRFSMWSK